MAARFDAASIRDYYDRHSASFVRYGQGQNAIHRAVWGPGTQTRDEAFHFVDDQVAPFLRRALARSADVHVVDLGCGVGASLLHLAQDLPVRGTGVTLSPAQATMARAAIASAGLADRIECLEADFSDLPDTVRAADVAYAIESFVHAPSARRFFEQCQRLVKPGGVLVICDDVLRSPVTGHAAAEVVESFKRGWHVNTLIDRHEMVEVARQAGFDHQGTQDLTPMLEIRRGRDRVLGVVVALLKRLPAAARRFDYIIGGHALQAALARGWIAYEINVFERRATAPPVRSKNARRAQGDPSCVATRSTNAARRPSAPMVATQFTKTRGWPH